MLDTANTTRAAIQAICAHTFYVNYVATIVALRVVRRKIKTEKRINGDGEDKKPSSQKDFFKTSSSFTQKQLSNKY